jgi:hypothetical protein
MTGRSGQVTIWDSSKSPYFELNDYQPGMSFADANAGTKGNKMHANVYKQMLIYLSWAGQL